jgi:MOSC domain-containing protein YiiM
MTGTILQVSVSQGGVPKRAIPAGALTLTGLEGDRHSHPDIHGGPRQAVLLITSEGIKELAALGFPLTHGSLGENLTTSGIHRRDWRVGQRWQIGAEVMIEITKRRAPCQTLNIYGAGIQPALFDALAGNGDPSSPKWGLSGFYASVIEPGVIRPSDEIVLVP